MFVTGFEVQLILGNIQNNSLLQNWTTSISIRVWPFLTALLCCYTGESHLLWIWILGEAVLLERSFTVSVTGSKWALLKGDFPASSPAPTPLSHPITSCFMMWALFFSSVFYALDSWQSISHTLRLPSVGTLRKRSRCCSRLSPRPPLCISDLNIKPVLDVSWSTSNFSGKNMTVSLFKISFLRLWMGWYTAHHPFCHPLTGLFPQRYSAYVAECSHRGTLTP